MEQYIKEAIEDLEIMYCYIESSDDNSEFLFGINLADNMEIERLIDNLKANQLEVVIQDKLIKIPSNSYNTKEDLQKLINCFRLCVSY